MKKLILETNCINKMFDEERPHQEELTERKADLINLGIFRSEIENRGGGIGGGSSAHNKAYFTDFGLKFLSFIKE